MPQASAYFRQAPIGGKGGIRTLVAGDPRTGFRVRRIRPLCHLSGYLKATEPVEAQGLRCLPTAQVSVPDAGPQRLKRIHKKATSLAQHFQATEVRPQRGWDSHAAIGLLVVFKHGHQGSAHGQA